MALKHKFLNYANDDGNNVSVPRSFQARAHSDPVNLAYITPQEQGILQTLKPGTPHRGPMEIPNYDSFDAAGGYSNPGGAGDKGGYSASSGGGGGGWQDTSRADQRTNEQAEQVRRNYVNKENIRSSYLHDRYDPNRIEGQNKLGGFFGGVGRGLLSIFGGIPGRIASGIMTARNLAKRTGAKIGEFGEEVDEFSQYPTWDRYINRNTDKYKDKPYRGQGQGYNFNDTGNSLGLQTNRLNEPYVDEGRIGEYWRNPPLTNNLGTNNQFVEEEQNFNMPLPMGSAEGGRIGYERGRVVNPGGYQGEEEGVDSVKHAIMLEQMDKLEKMIASGLDSDGRLQARLDQLIATPTTGFGTGPDLVLPDDNPDLVLPDDKAQGGIARLL